MMNTLTSAAALTLIAVAGLSSQPRRDPIEVSLPAGIDLDACRLESFLTGSFGGYGTAVNTAAGQAFRIDATHEGSPVDRARAVLYCPGYEVAALDFPSLLDVGPRNVMLQPKTLGTVPFAGVVLGDLGPLAEPIDVRAEYLPTWKCELFGILDCMLSAWRTGSAMLDADGRFSLALPDFAHDPVVSSFKDHGEFRFRIRGRKTGNILFRLEPAGGGTPSRAIAVAASYQREQIFRLVGAR